MGNNVVLGSSLPFSLSSSLVSPVQTRRLRNLFASLFRIGAIRIRRPLISRPQTRLFSIPSTIPIGEREICRDRQVDLLFKVAVMVPISTE